jgi:hypothetical protein
MVICPPTPAQFSEMYLKYPSPFTEVLTEECHIFPIPNKTAINPTFAYAGR